jgi:hypothetical protein
MARGLHRAVPAALALLACAGPSREAAAGAAGPGAVALRFAWPAGFQTRVLLRHEARRSGRAPAHAVVRHLIVAETRGKEIWIFNRDTEGEGDEPGLDVNLRIGEAVIQVVAPDGTFLRAEGLDEALAFLPGADDAGREGARKALARLAAEDWELTAGAWQGRRLEEGAAVGKQVEGSVPLLPGLVAPLDVELLLQGRVPCEEGEAEARCVQLSYRAEPAASEKRALLRKMGAALANGMGDSEVPVLQDFSASRSATLVAEPDTLVPHRLSVREEMALRLRLPGGDLREVEERTRDEYRFAGEVAL